jgi:hypothetical protein
VHSTEEDEMTHPIRLRFLLLLLIVSTLLVAEPALANKFVTIGSGVSGSSSLKLGFLTDAAYITGAIFALMAVGALLMRNRNAHSVDFTLGKQAAIILAILSSLCFLFALLA